MNRDYMNDDIPLSELKPVSSSFDDLAAKGASPQDKETQIIEDLTDGEINPAEFSDDFNLPGSLSLKKFPIESLPETIRNHVISVSLNSSVLHEMAGTFAISALFVAIRGRYSVKRATGYLEPCSAYVALVAKVAERKSSTLGFFTAPILEYEKEYNEGSRQVVEESKSIAKSLQMEKERAEKNHASAEDEAKDVALDELRNVIGRIGAHTTLDYRDYFGDDCTAEKLDRLLYDQGGVFALVSTEGDGVFQNLGKYNNNSASKAGINTLLKAFTGDSVSVNRMGDSERNFYIPRALLNIVAACQPFVLDGILSDKTLAGRGLLARFLYVVCRPLAGFRPSDTEVPALDESAKEAYNALMSKILAGEETGSIELSQEALEVYNCFHGELEPQLEEYVGEMSNMHGWGDRCTSYLFRLAGLVHIINAYERNESPLATQISGAEMQAAYTLTFFFINHAKFVFNVGKDTLEAQNAIYLIKKMVELEEPISRRDLDRRTQNKGGFDLDDSLALLIKGHCIRSETIGTSRLFFTNPKAKAELRFINNHNRGQNSDSHPSSPLN